MPHHPLWPDTAELSPLAALEPFPVDTDDGPVVLVLPGGGYQMHADHEGPEVARWLNGLGYAAAVLRYRCGPDHRHPAPIHDASAAARRLRRGEGGLDFPAKRLAVLGFSAGGHLAATLATRPDDWVDERDTMAGSVSAAVDAVVLAYPVITLTGPDAHEGSRVNLLGECDDGELLARLDPAQSVTAASPPAFLWHTADDPGVAVGNTLQYAAACHRAGVPVEAHVYETGPHGLGLAPDHPAGAWTVMCEQFLARHLGGGP